MRKRILFIALFSLLIGFESIQAQYTANENIPYYPDSIAQSDTYMAERCVLDLYYPEHSDGFATIVWFHGGGLIPFSGHAITHFTVREERGIEGTRPVVDDLAPLYHVRADAPPLLLITGDREKEMLGRYEENAYLMRMMKVAGHEETRLYELDGYGHGMTAPAFPLLLDEVQRIQEMIRNL